MAYIFHYIWSSLKIMCIAFIVLLLENIKLFYRLLLFCLYIEILAVSSLFKCLVATKCSESRVETLQNFCFRFTFYFPFHSFPMLYEKFSPLILHTVSGRVFVVCVPILIFWVFRHCWECFRAAHIKGIINLSVTFSMFAENSRREKWNMCLKVTTV